MARRSNKTAHVLNLIAGHEAKEDSEEVVSQAEAETSASADAGQAAPAPAPSTQPPQQNISVIDTTEKDPVADLIQQKLSDALDEETHMNGNPIQTGTPAGPEAADPIRPEAPAQPADASATPPQTAAPAQAEAPAQPAPDQPDNTVSGQPENAARPADAPAQAEAAHQAVPAADMPAASPEPEPEPPFAAVNVMERIVQDKIIYYMRQFEVCTCERCVADTIALTLNGLTPKYIVTMPAAVDPLLSYYTNRLISDVTVEATKACMVVKENPRH